MNDAVIIEIVFLVTVFFLFCQSEFSKKENLKASVFKTTALIAIN